MSERSPRPGGTPLSRRRVLKAASGAAATLGAAGVSRGPYRRALAQDDVTSRILAIPGPGSTPTGADMERVGELVLRTTKRGAFAGQTVAVMAQHVDTLRPLSRVWEDATGATITWIPMVTLGQAADEVAAGAAPFDILEGGACAEGDLLPDGHCLSVPDAVKAAIDWDDILDVRKAPVSAWAGVDYGVPIDGDLHHLLYRRDVFADPVLADEWQRAGGDGAWEPPQTWQQVQTVTAFLAGKQLYGRPIYGMLDVAADPKYPQYFLISRASAYVKHPDDPAVFFDPTSMTPRINSPGFVRALDDLIAALPSEPPGQQSANVDTPVDQFLAGKGALTTWWPSPGAWVQTNPFISVSGKVGFDLLPGSPDVYNSTTGQWDTLPQINRAPHLAFLGWSLYVTAAAAGRGVTEAAWDLVAHLAGKELSLWMCVYAVGANPYRKSHFDTTDWTAIGYAEDDVQEYLRSIRTSFDHPNRIVDLRIPGTLRYFQAAEEECTRAITGDVDAPTALDNAARRWDEITDELGRDRQRAFYQDTLG
jgi:multiple sugar transport system substrate-binding protein